MTIFRLTSQKMFVTPGVINWARSGMRHNEFMDFMRKGWPTITDEARENLYAGIYNIEPDEWDNGTVVVMG